MKYELNRIYQGDCMDYMKDIPDNFFELAIVDIEYCIGASNPSKKSGYVKQKNGNKIYVKAPDYGKKDWDFQKSSNEYFNQLFRVSKDQIIFGGNYYGLEGGYLVWDKLNRDTDQFGCELAWLSFTKRTDIIYFLWSGMIQGKYCGKNVRKALIQQGNKKLNEKRIHSTQKPVALYKCILNEYAKEGYKILDTHGGSMSLGIACIDFGFDFMIIEKDHDIFHKAKTRLNNHLIQMDLTRHKKFQNLQL